VKKTGSTALRVVITANSRQVSINRQKVENGKGILLKKALWIGEELTPFKKGVASFQDVGKDGNPDIVITFIECEPGKSKPVKKTSVFKYSGGKLMEIRDGRPQ